MAFKDIKAIGFDSGTLIDNMPNRALAFADSVIRFYPGLENEKEGIKQNYLDRVGVCSKFEQLIHIMEEYDLPEQLEEGWREEWSKVFETKVLFDKDSLTKKVDVYMEVKSVLETLSKDYALFLSTSAKPRNVKKIDEQIKLGKFFKFLLGSKHGFSKGIEHFRYVAEQLGIGFGQMAFVCDSPEDIRMANNAGLYSVGVVDFRYNSREGLETENPNLIIRTLDDLFRSGF
jgi:phosphoglycolate phosphatase-like HAD superfamily hydrolase